MGKRLFQIMLEKNQCLLGDETLIYVKGEEVFFLHNDGETLSEVTMKLKEEDLLRDFLWSLLGDEDDDV